MRVRLTKSFRFEAAHQLTTFPPGHKCRELHGHGYKVDVCVEGEVDESKGYLIDYGEIKAACDPIRKMLDHKNLNEIEGLDVSTAEMLARWIYDRLKPSLPMLAAVIVYESETTSCEYRGE